VSALDLLPGSVEELLGGLVHEYPMHVQISDSNRLRDGVQSPFQKGYVLLDGAQEQRPSSTTRLPGNRKSEQRTTIGKLKAIPSRLTIKRRTSLVCDRRIGGNL